MAHREFQSCRISKVQLWDTAENTAEKTLEKHRISFKPPSYTTQCTCKKDNMSEAINVEFTQDSLIFLLSWLQIRLQELKLMGLNL